jgi:hypothetical protein
MLKLPWELPWRCSDLRRTGALLNAQISSTISALIKNLSKKMGPRKSC